MILGSSYSSEDLSSARAVLLDPGFFKSSTPRRSPDRDNWVRKLHRLGRLGFRPAEHCSLRVRLDGALDTRMENIKLLADNGGHAVDRPALQNARVGSTQDCVKSLARISILVV